METAKRLPLAGFILLSLASMRWYTLTYEEPDHYQYGLQLLNGEAKRFDLGYSYLIYGIPREALVKIR